MRRLMLPGFADGFVVWLILDVMLSFMQALRLSSVRRDRRLDLIFLRYENDRSHASVDPNKVNTAILIRSSVWYVTGNGFQGLIISWYSG